MGKRNGYFGGFLTRLAKNQAGNTLAIVAAALIPLAGMIGGGLDISRGYLAKTRLQQACDAGVLAGRKVMGSSGVMSDAVTAEVRKYVNFNFPSGYLGITNPLTINPTLGTNDQLQLTLTTPMPTVIMRLFKQDTMNVTATCSARNDYSNIDIVLVLDTTGSMACKPERDGDSCSDWINSRTSPKSGKTMTVNSKTVTYVCEENSNETCSGGTNVSRMQGLRTALTNLQSQMATIESQFNMTEQGKRKRVRWAIIPFSQMVNAGLSEGGGGNTLYSRNPGWFNTTGNYQQVGQSCDRYGRCSTTITARNNIAHDDTWMSNSWDGCVEEQSTSNTITSTSSSIPATAYDMNFDTVPSSTATKWTVADPSQAGLSQYACPKAMRELQKLTATEFNDYFAFNNGFAANGGTYLDLGMLWAARMLSRTGNWSARNPLLFNTYPVNRYVIMMTDGTMDTGNSGYGAYAQEYIWKRITSDGSSTTSNRNHSARLLLALSLIHI